MPATLALVADRWPPERRALPLASSARCRRPARCSARWPGRRCSRSPTGGRSSGSTCCSGSAWRSASRGHRRAAAVPTRSASRWPRVAGARPRRCSWPRRPRWPRTSPSGCSTSRWSTSLALTTPLVLVAVRRRRRRWSSAACAARPGGAAAARSAAAGRARSTSLGSALVVVALGSLVWAFAAADPATQVVAAGPVCCRWRVARRRSPSCCTSGARPRRCCRSRALRPIGAWGALLVNLLVGAALVAALVDVPLFARATTTPGRPARRGPRAARLLIAVPVGAVAGGWLCRTVAAAARRRRRDGAGRGRLRRHDRLGRAVAGRRVVDRRPARRRAWASAWPSRRSTRAAGRHRRRGARQRQRAGRRRPHVGMLVGLSLLTAVALRRFTAEIAAIGSPFELCPRHAGRLRRLRRRHRRGRPHPAAHRLRRCRGRRRASPPSRRCCCCREVRTTPAPS